MTTQPLPDRWASRDLPVLMAAAQRLDAGEIPVTASDLAEDTGLELDAVLSACRALNPTYFVGKMLNSMAGAYDFMTTDLTERGRRTVGIWPSEASTIGALEEALRQAEAATDDPAERSRIRQMLGAMTSVSREILVDVMGNVIARQSGLG